jgi:hypothetical protein
MANRYFVLGTPGTSVNFIAHVLKYYIDSVSGYPAIINQPIFLQDVGENPSSELFYDNVTFENNLPNILGITRKEDVEKLKFRFPGCKIILISHSIPDIVYISNSLFTDYYQTLEYPGSENSFRKILENHPSIFIDPNKSPSDLTDYEKDAFKKIIQYYSLVDGYSNIQHDETANLAIIGYRNLMLDKEAVLEKISQFLEIETPSDAISFYTELQQSALDKISYNNLYK